MPNIFTKLRAAVTPRGCGGCNRSTLLVFCSVHIRVFENGVGSLLASLASLYAFSNLPKLKRLTSQKPHQSLFMIWAGFSPITTTSHNSGSPSHTKGRSRQGGFGMSSRSSSAHCDFFSTISSLGPFPLTHNTRLQPCCDPRIFRTNLRGGCTISVLVGR